MSLNKRYLKSKPLCKVTFKLPKEAAPYAGSVFLVGDFNAWDKQATPMQRMKNGSFCATLDLPTGSTYQFRYLRDDGSWENDWQADGYVPNPFGDGENSVVHI
jgi:1,4-alpha-glucan branching enzyme